MTKKYYRRMWRQPMVSAVLAASLALSPVAVLAASSSDAENNTALKNDLLHADIIDQDRTGSVTIHKYDITAAEAAGDYTQGQYKATGEKDTRVETALEDYAIQGVQFTYLKVGDIEQYIRNSSVEGSEICLVYEIPDELRKILKLETADALDLTEEGVTQPCTKTGVYHYTSTQISEALQEILTEDEIRTKNDLEEYLYSYGAQDEDADDNVQHEAVNMPETDENGVTSVSDLPLGLYLVAETRVPEQVTSSVNPWFVSLPFTNTAADQDNGIHAEDGITIGADVEGTDANVSGGEQWLYDMVCYPKNQTGNPTLDKSVRNAYSSAAAADKNKTVDVSDSYDGSGTSEQLIVRNNDQNTAGFEKDTDDAAYVSNRGGYTADGLTPDKNSAGYSYDYQYRDTTTASEGDLLDYILVSRLPHITSQSTYISEYTFTDQLSRGITYNQDVRIALYRTEEDARVNNTVNAAEIWNLADGQQGSEYARMEIADTGSDTDKHGQRMVIRMTEAGLQKINGEEDSRNGYSDYYMVVYYTATVNSDATVALGDEGNINDVSLLWSRTNNTYTNSLQDRNYVYTYGIDLTKTFSDDKGDASHVQFKLYNQTDAYYVVARKDADGQYYVTGKTVDEADATTFIPAAADGNLYVSGLEADTYQLSEVATDDGYTLLKEPVEIAIQATDREVIASVAGTTGLDKDAAENIVKNYGAGIKNENGQLVTEGESELMGDSEVPGPKEESADGRTIGLTDMYVGDIHSASATVDGIAAKMENGTAATGIGSENAVVVMRIVNNKGFLLPQTGGNGLYLITVFGVLTAGFGCYLMNRKSGKDSSK